VARSRWPHQRCRSANEHVPRRFQPPPHLLSKARTTSSLGGARGPMSSDACLEADPTLATPRSLPDHNPGREAVQGANTGGRPDMNLCRRPARRLIQRKLDARPFDRKIQALSIATAAETVIPRTRTAVSLVKPFGSRSASRLCLPHPSRQNNYDIRRLREPGFGCGPTVGRVDRTPPDDVGSRGARLDDRDVRTFVLQCFDVRLQRASQGRPTRHRCDHHDTITPSNEVDIRPGPHSAVHITATIDRCRWVDEWSCATGSDGGYEWDAGISCPHHQ